MGWQIGIWIVLAVAVFWTVGAYNRLVSLRNALVRSFDPVDLQFTMRHALLDRQIDAIGAVLSNAAERLETLRAACAQSEMARAHAKAHPGAPGAITSLRLADEILAEARARLPVQAIGGLDMSALNAELGAVDTTLAFARRQFNEAVLAYNRAIRQIPTRLIAAIFGFEAAGTL
ncbi:MAG: LemA family protein [Caldimonas sp.]